MTLEQRLRKPGAAPDSGGGLAAIALLTDLIHNFADPLIGLTITAVILRITWDSWRTLHHGHPHGEHAHH